MRPQLTGEDPAKVYQGLRDLTYVERLRELQALAIANRMIYDVR
jgi:hypothetical protein